MFPITCLKKIESVGREFFFVCFFFLSLGGGLTIQKKVKNTQKSSKKTIQPDFLLRVGASMDGRGFHSGLWFVCAHSLSSQRSGCANIGKNKNRFYKKNKQIVCTALREKTKFASSKKKKKKICVHLSVIEKSV